MEVSSSIDYYGISNEGATCYINSLLQSLFYTNEFRDLIYNTAIDSEDVNDSFVFISLFFVTAAELLKFCCKDLKFMKNCENCYEHFCANANDWLVKACNLPHLVLWVDIQDCDFWPADKGNIRLEFLLRFTRLKI